ncbi:MAG: periplasmic divalent cation tolerance protein [Natronomonas sp.]|jgi:periplasmic divalent cation tolerance protein
MPTVYITAPPDAADGLTATLVEERLAACVEWVEASVE